MVNFLKKIFFIFIILFSLNFSYCFTNQENCFLGECKIDKKLKGSEKSLSDTVVDYVTYLLTFLFFIAVVYGLYGGYKILTAQDDDEKVKKGKTIIIQSIIGLVIIFLAGPIARFFLGGEGEKGLLEKTGTGVSNP